MNRLDAPYREADAEKTRLAGEEKEIRKRGTVAYVMQERTNAPEAYVLFRGDYDQRRDRVTPDHAGGACRRCPPTRRATGLVSRNGCCARKTR